MSFEQLIKTRLEQPVFRLPDGTASANLRQTFKIFMKDTGLLTCPRTGQDRTLYSLRHTYATFSLLNDGMDVHTLAVQMGTSILMIERHYSHLTPRLKKEMLTGKRYDTPHKDYTADLSNGFAVTDEDLQRAIDDVEIEDFIGINIKKKSLPTTLPTTKHQIKTELIRGYCTQPLRFSYNRRQWLPHSTGPASRTTGL